MAKKSLPSSTALVATCTVSYDGFGKHAGMNDRISLLRECCARVADHSVRLVCFPGGYLFCRNEREILELRKKLEHLSAELSVTIAVGVDMAKKSIDKAGGTEDSDRIRKKLIREYRLPWFAVCAYPDGTSDLWRQRSIDNSSQYDAPDDCCSEFHGVRGLIPQTEILMCGEIFNKRIRAGVISRGTQLVVDLGHHSKGFRVHAAMKPLASQGVTTLCSVLANKLNATKYCYVPNSSVHLTCSTTSSDFTVGLKPRIEMKIWNFDTLRLT